MLNEWLSLCTTSDLCIDVDRAIIVEFRHLAPAQPDLMCSIVLDINAGDHWEGGHYVKSLLYYDIN